VPAVVNVGINLDASGATRSVDGLNGSLNQLEAAVNNTNRGVEAAGRNYQTAANGLKYWIDSNGRARDEFGKFLSASDRAAAGLSNFKGSLLAIGAELLSLTGIAVTAQQAFNTLAQQSKAEAALKTLGVNANIAVQEFTKLSASLSGQASVVELTTAAYDVASAGFGKTADQVNILDAATRGAVGGLSDINTVGNAVTSVLNAYGMSASNANTLVDQFIQTQNDGKIILAEYATQIGRLAPTASAAGVGVEELNAAIATATAQGVPVEATFTGLNQALVSILKPTQEAQELAGQLGIQFNEAGLRTKGFGGLLAEVAQKTGGSTTQLVQLFGSVDALKAVLPLTNDGLVKFNENLKKQYDSAGVATKAFNDMKNSLGGVLKELQTAFQNLVVAFQPVIPAIIAPIKVLSAALNGISQVIGFIAKQAVFFGTFVGVLNAAAIATKIWSAATVALGLAKKGAAVAAAFLQAILNPASIAKIAVALGVATAASVTLGNAMGVAGQEAANSNVQQLGIKDAVAQTNEEIQKQVAALQAVPPAQQAALDKANETASAYKQQTEAIKEQISALERGASLTGKRYEALQAINSLEQQQLERSYQQATTEQQRFDIATKLFGKQLEAAQLEYNQAIEAIKLEERKLDLRLQLEQSKLNEINAEADLQKLKASDIKNTDERLKKEQEIDQKRKDALESQKSVVREIEAQIPFQKEISKYEEQIAAAKFESNKLTAQTNYEQKLTTKEIGLSQEQASRLSQETANTYDITRDLKNEYSGVVMQIERAVSAQQQLNALRAAGTGGGYQGAADGAYWQGGFKAFADGGVVTKPTLGMIGEGGEPEYVIPASKMSEAMQRYAAGQRGSSVIPTSVNPQVNVTTGPVMNMNGTNYVSQSDFLNGMQTASRRGAEMALQMLQANNNTRRMVGIA